MDRPRRPKHEQLYEYLVKPLQPIGEHHYQCPICGHLVDDRDLEEVLHHFEPDHPRPTRH